MYKLVENACVLVHVLIALISLVASSGVLENSKNFSR